MKRRPKRFSVTKAVKGNARDRVGTPKPTQTLPDEREKAERRALRHKLTLPRMLNDTAEDEHC